MNWTHKSLFILLLFLLLFVILMALINFNKEFSDEREDTDSLSVVEEADPKITYPIDEATGLIDDENLNLVVANCTACHSSALIIQNRASREGWKSMITWMQETQKLWDLGENEDAILDYLAKHYAPSERNQRRNNLEGIEWYVLGGKSR